MSNLFTPLTLRGTTFKNRLWVSPMCQYSAVDGMPNDWHLVHLGSRAVGGAGLVMAESTAICAAGRISPDDTGIWSDIQASEWRRIARFIREQGSLPGIQLGHAGRKASTYAPWKGQGTVPENEGGWPTVAPSEIAFNGYAVPAAMSLDNLADIKQLFVDAAQRANSADFEVIEVHSAHGYLLHQFLSPLSNQRTDEYGGSFENRTRFPLEVITAVRNVWPSEKPLFVRISASDWVEGGWSLDESILFAGLMKEVGVDLIDVSSGGLVHDARIQTGPGYQVPFSDAIKSKAEISTAAVGQIDNATQAEQIIGDGSADAVFVARQHLRDPYFGLHAAHELGDDVEWPVQYQRAKLPIG